jgi:acyl transferase domain-containing protein
MTETDTADRVAIIGMSGRFPGFGDVEGFWRGLVQGREGSREYSRAELASAGVPAAELADPAYVRRGFPLAGFAEFDAEFFGLTPAEAEVTDPQHRIFLECCWEAMERAGYPPDAYPGAVGVFAASSMSAYLIERVSRSARATQIALPLQISLGNDPGAMALRVSYRLNLTGPSMTVQSACSSSLVAVHQAVQSLLSHESDLALAGGAAVRLLGPQGYRYVEGGVLSRDGRCRPFDASSTGTAAGDGAGVVVLKRLAAALADGDQIHAVIRGSAVNNDGAAKLGFTAPSVDGQAAVIAEAMVVAGVDGGGVDYVETHGTGTVLGDPIEVRALTDAYRGAPPGSCRLGAVKANVGHLDTAAGIAGLIKTVLALANRYIPPNPNLAQHNPALGLAGSPFVIEAAGAPWPERDHVPCAAVSSFGMGGANAHVILEAAPPVASTPPTRKHQIVTVSAATSAAVADAAERLAGRLGAEDAALADVAWTLQTGRSRFRHRRAVVVGTGTAAAAAIRVRATATAVAEPVVGFVLGRGESHGAGELYRAEPAYRAAIDEWARAVGAEPVDVLAGPAGEYAGARLLMSWGVRPGVVFGFGWGELVAACLAGVMTVADAARAVAAGQESLRTAELRAPEDIVVFAGRATAMTAREAVDPAYWMACQERARRPVDLAAAAVRTHVTVMCAPGAVDAPNAGPDVATAALLHRETGAAQQGALRCLARMWEHGVEPDWASVHTGASRRRVTLPTYPFQRTEYLLPAETGAVDGAPLPRQEPASAVVLAENLPDDTIAGEIARIWREVLGVAELGPHDDFYEIGGNSLYAMQMVAQLGERYGELPPSILFEASTVTELAAEIRRRQAESIGLAEFDALLREVEAMAGPEELGGGRGE